MEKTALKVQRAMKQTSGYPPTCWWQDPETVATLTEGVKNGWLYRPSVTQIEWTEKGIEAVRAAENEPAAEQGAGYYSERIKKPRNKQEGLANFVQMIINDLEAGKTNEALLRAVDLKEDIRSKIYEVK